MRALLLSVLLVASLATAGLAGAQESPAGDPPTACVGAIEQGPDQETIASIQGSRVTSEGAFKEQALLVSFGPDGSLEWAQNSSANGRWWAYDVDPMDNGTLLYATTEPGNSVVGAFDPGAGEYEWVKRFDGEPDDETTPLVTDAHDADLLGEHELVLADKGEGHERILVYNLTSDRVAWEWRFENHPDRFPASGGGSPDDWTHVNDVDQVGEDLFMASVRNFDQVVFLNRTTDEVEMTLGEDDEHDVLFEQHNPDHLWGPRDEHTVLVADSRNDRVVEYEYQEDADEWERVWSATGFDEPRDADRLPNGNTLVADRRGHRLVEVTPEGRTVWEVYTPFEPYDVERGPVDESEGPTMAEQNASGEVALTNDAGFSTAEIETCADALFEFASPDRSIGGVDPFTRSDGAGTPGDGSDGGDDDGDGNDRDGGEGTSDGDLPAGPVAIVAGVLAVVVGRVGAAWYRRR